jgi:hypothetical protein
MAALRLGAAFLLATTLAAAELSGDEIRAHLQPGEVWAGNYTCGSAPAWLLLHIEAVRPRVEAVFHFVYPNSGTHGAFTVVEAPSAEASSAVAGRLVLDAGSWLMRPDNAEMVGMHCGVLAAEPARMVGAILHPHCEAFELVRARVDVAVVDAAPRALLHHTFRALQHKLARAGLGPRATPAIRRGDAEAMPPARPTGEAEHRGEGGGGALESE